MVQTPKVGDIIRLRHTWHGVVLDVFTSRTGRTVLRVQTVRNIFRRLNPEFIELDLAPDMVELATIDDLKAEIEHYKRQLDDSISDLISRCNAVQHPISAGEA